MPLPTKDLVIVCRQLATAYNAGIPIIRALDLAAEGTRNPATRETLQQMSLSVRNGNTLADAARREKDKLPPLLVEMLATGEQGGRLDVMLRELSEYFEASLRLRQRMLSMLILPILYLAAAWFLGGFALGIGARLKVFFEGKGYDINDYIGEYLRFQAGALVVFAIIAAALFALHRFGVLHRLFSEIVRVVWPFNEVVRKFALARFFRSFALLVTSGLNIKQCIQRAALVANHPRIGPDLMRAIPLVAEGHTLSTAFAGSYSLTPTAREMIAVGEESGELDKMLHKAAEYHEAEAAHTLDRALRILGVFITLAVGALIGYIVISFYASYFDLLNSIR